ncbi:MAG: D-alanyl-D-alanine carboxypeptidase family protein [Pedococcus sp.]
MAGHRPMSARRRARLRRTVTALSLFVVAGGVATYAMYAAGHEDEAVPATSASRPGPAPATSATPAATVMTAGAAKFVPVLTDRIPAPTTSIAVDAPVPGTTNMQPPAAAAFKAAFAGAKAAGLSPQIKSAWRSEQWQQVLYDRAVTKYGTRAEATKWVLPPLASAHVKGYAVDVRPENVAAWLEDHGAAYGVCRAYDNEWWHFEYVATDVCPARKPDAAG